MDRASSFPCTTTSIENLVTIFITKLPAFVKTYATFCTNKNTRKQTSIERVNATRKHRRSYIPMMTKPFLYALENRLSPLQNALREINRSGDFRKTGPRVSFQMRIRKMMAECLVSRM
jgi:hypothetical protein